MWCPIKHLQSACAHHPLAPSSERRGVGDLTPLLVKEGAGGGFCKELAGTSHQPVWMSGPRLGVKW